MMEKDCAVAEKGASLSRKDYSLTRYAYNPKRSIVWEEVARYLAGIVDLPAACGVELGCGYGDWIGNMDIREKTAIEMNAFLAGHARDQYGLDVREGNVFDILPGLGSDVFDVVQASNFFEHFDMDQVDALLAESVRVLRPGGRLLVIQPNYRYCHKTYFDDYTHRSVHSHVSFSDLLESHGLEVDHCEPRFLPFSFKSRLPVNRWLVRAYLRFPIKPMGAQFLICASLKSESK